MKKNCSIALIILMTIPLAFGQRVENFQLMDAVSGNQFALDDHLEEKAVVLIFTSLSCPFSKLYEDRIIAIHDKFASEGFAFALVNPHAGQEVDEGAEAMKARAAERQYQFPYLDDSALKLAKQLGITKLPEAVVLTPSPTGFAVAYRGAIDNNPQVAANANVRYLESALTNILNKRNPSPASSRAVGCNVRGVN